MTLSSRALEALEAARASYKHAASSCASQGSMMEAHEWMQRYDRTFTLAGRIMARMDALGQSR